MDSKSLLIGVIIGILLGAAVAYLTAASQITALRDQVNVIKTDAGKVPALQQQILNLTSEKTSLLNELKTAQDELNLLKQTDLVKEVLERDAQIAQLSSQISSLNSQVENLQAEIDVFQSSKIQLIAVSFSRTQDTSSLIQYWIGRANQTIEVAVYSFTQDALGDAIVAAKNRGVSVQVYIDNKYVSSTGSEYPRLQSAGVPIKADDRSADMHHKFFVIDGYIVGTGSYNWSQAAEDENDENLALLRSTDLAQKYMNEFNRLWTSS